MISIGAGASSTASVTEGWNDFCAGRPVETYHIPSSADRQNAINRTRSASS